MTSIIFVVALALGEPYLGVVIIVCVRVLVMQRGAWKLLTHIRMNCMLQQRRDPSAVPLFAPTSADLPCATFMGAYGNDLAALNGQLISPQKNQ